MRIFRTLTVLAVSLTPVIALESTAHASVAKSAPGAPVVSVKSSSLTSVSIQWTVPDAGSSPITRYETRRSGLSLPINTPSSATSQVLSSLTAGSSYTVKVRACNAVGCSDDSTGVLATTKPPAPSKLVAIPGDTSVTVSWDKSKGAAEFTESVWYKTAAGSAWTEHTPETPDVSPVTVSGLTNGVSYLFKVTATNAGGATDSMVSSPVIPRTKPSVPVVKLDSATTTSLSVSWQTASSGGLPVSSHKVFRNNTFVGLASANKYTLSKLLPGQTHNVQVQACSMAGCSALSDALALMTKPDGPSNVSAVADSAGGVSVSWKNSTSTATHHVLYRTSPTAAWLPWTPDEPDVSPVTVTGLDKGKTHYFAVASRNTGGDTIVAAKETPTPRTPPAAPHLSFSNITTTSATALWAKPPDGGSPVASYQVKLNGSQVASTSTLSTRLTLSPGTLNKVAVRACNAAGCSDFSDEVSLTSLPLPTKASVTLGDSSATVSWPESSSAVVDGYSVQYKKLSDRDWTTWTPGDYDHSPAVITGLDNGVMYNFRVLASNTSGGSPSEMASGITVGPPHAPPAPALSQIGTTFMTVTFAAPLNNGGSPLTVWELWIDGSKHSEYPASKKVQEVSGLAGGKSHSFAAKACNAKGCSLTGPAASSVTKPLPPTGLDVVTSMEGATVSWVDSSSPTVDSHNVYYRLATSLTWTEHTPGESDSSPTIVTGLTPGFTYHFRVTAANAAGLTHSATKITSTQGTSPPAAPADVQSQSLGGKIKLFWTPPTEDPAAPLIESQIQFSTDLSEPWSDVPGNGLSLIGPVSDTGTEISGASGSLLYSFRVRTSNKYGFSPWSLPTAPIAPIQPPTAPSQVTGVPSSQSVSVLWVLSADNGGSLVTGHFLQYSKNDGPWSPSVFVSGPVTQHTFSGLVNGVSYSFRVAASNAAGIGEFSDPSPAVTPSGLPSLPGSIQASSGNKTATLSWTAPSDDGGTQVTDYAIEYSTNGGITWVLYSDAVSVETSAVVSGLTNGTPYVFRVAALNANGSGYFSTTSLAVTPHTVPSAPSVSSVATSTSSITVSFVPSLDDGGATVTAHTVSCASTNGGASRSQSSLASPIVVSSLTAGKNYTCGLTSTNAAGDSASAKVATLEATWVDTSYYHCPSGGSLSGGTCTQTVFTGYSCPSGGSHIGGGTCRRADFTGYSCPSGGSHIGGGTCRRVDFTGYSCPSGGYVSGATCITPAYQWSRHEWMELWADWWGSTWVCPSEVYYGATPYHRDYDTLLCHYWEWADPADYGATANYANYDYGATANYSYPTYAATYVSQGYWNGWSKS